MIETIRHRGIEIPVLQMGKVSSADLFEEREQQAFDLYERHRSHYRRVLDVGANIGVHSIIMAKLGWDVMAFEPDPSHFEHLRQNVVSNGVASKVRLYRHALSDHCGPAKFTRVLDNTTASHLDGTRGHHGPVEQFDVSVLMARAYLHAVDFAKVDCEGSEADVVCSVEADIDCEFLIEIGSAENARRIYEHFGDRQMWRQGEPWTRVLSLADVPTHYREGSLFVGEQP